MDFQWHVRALRAADADAFAEIRREAVAAEPLAFGSSPDDDRCRASDFVRTMLADERQAVFGGFEGVRLVGVVGLFAGENVKERHRGTIWGMYVEPAARGRGLGRALLDAAVVRARADGLDHVGLSVTDAAPTAKHLYEAAGFREWGREPRALRWRERFVDEHHLVLDLRPPVG